jgi:hypothetical protein
MRSVACQLPSTCSNYSRGRPGSGWPPFSWVTISSMKVHEIHFCNILHLNLFVLWGSLTFIHGSLLFDVWLSWSISPIKCMINTWVPICCIEFNFLNCEVSTIRVIHPLFIHPSTFTSFHVIRFIHPKIISFGVFRSISSLKIHSIYFDIIHPSTFISYNNGL